MKRKLVIAPDYRWFDRWCREQGINPRSPEVFYILGPEDLRGWSGAGVEIVVLEFPRWWRSEHFARLEMLKLGGAEVRYAS